MKKIFLALIAAAAVFAVGCSKETDVRKAELKGPSATVSFDLNFSGIATRAFADGQSVNQLYVGVYNEDGTYYPTVSAATTPIAVSAGTATFQANLVKGISYKIVFWAQKGGNGVYAIDFPGKKVSANYASVVANNEALDAFYAVVSIDNLQEALTKTVELKRPLAQINVLAKDSDVADAAKLNGMHCTASSFVVDGVKPELNLITGALQGTEAAVTFSAAACNEATILDGYSYVGMTYILAAADNEPNKKVTIGVNLADNAQQTYSNSFDVENVPVRRNFRTNIVGNVFTAGTIFNVEVKPGFDGTNTSELGGDTIQGGVTAVDTGALDPTANPDFFDGSGNFTTDITVNEGETLDFSVLVSTAGEAPSSYASDNEGVATITAAGLLTAVAPGTANITVHYDAAVVTRATVQYPAADVVFTVTVPDGSVTPPDPSYEFTTIAGLLALAEGEHSGKLENVVVTFRPEGDDRYVFIKDASASTVLYQTGKTPAIGQTFSGEVTVTLGSFHQAKQLTSFSGVFGGDGAAVEPEIVTLAAVAADYAKYENAFVKVVDAQVVSKESKNINVTQDGTAYILFDNKNGITVNAGQLITAIGTVTRYDATEEIKVWVAADATVRDAGGKATATITASDVSVEVGQTKAIGATTNSSATLSYISGNEAIATVSAEGIVQGIAEGSTTVTITVPENDDFTEAEKVINVTVTAAGSTPNYDFTSIAELTALATGQSYSGKLENVVVAFVPEGDTRDYFIKDASGSTLIYIDGFGAKVGQTFSGEVTVTLGVYQNVPQITAFGGTFTGAEAEVEPEIVTLSQLVGNFNKYQNAFVKVVDADVVSKSSKNINVTQGTASYIIFDNKNGITVEAGNKITAKGTITKYNSTEELKVWVATDATVTAEGPATQHLSFSPTSLVATLGSSFTEPTLSGAMTTVTYSSSNEAVATVDPSTGALTLVAAGSATITATAVATADYKEGTASYALTVMSAGQTVVWAKKALSEIKDGDVVVLVQGDAFAMSNNNGTSTAPAAVAVAPAGGVLASPASTIQWVAEVSADGLIFYSSSEKTAWLYCTNSNNGLRVGTNDNKLFTITADGDGAGYLYNTATSRWLGVYNSQDWRCYALTGQGAFPQNITGQTFSAYVKTIQ
ncbi:MAG: Ig-like domain-containing protein [Bacteroidales bacterium]|nr:Ig-like domain-containing protein [Bacteroidales bacterium]